MSLRYRLLGIPKTQEEFARVLKKKDIEDVRVNLYGFNLSNFIHTSGAYFIGGEHYILVGGQVHRLGKDEEYWGFARRTKDRTLNGAIETADFLESEGLKVIFNDANPRSGREYSISEVRAIAEGTNPTAWERLWSRKQQPFLA